MAQATNNEERERFRARVKEVLSRQPTPDTMTPEQLKRVMATERQFFDRLTRPRKKKPYKFSRSIRGISPQI